MKSARGSVVPAIGKTFRKRDIAMINDPSEPILPQVIRGRFWFPEHPTLILTGELRISAPHQYDLFLDLPHYGLTNPGYWESRIGKEIPIILGVTVESQPLTCSDCQIYSSSTSYGAPRSVSWHQLKIWAHCCIFGAHIEDVSCARFSKFSGYFTGFNLWASAYDGELFPDDEEDKKRTGTKRRDEIKGFGAITILEAGAEAVSIGNVSRRTQIRYWKPSFEPSANVSLDQLLDIVRDFQRLLCLFQGMAVGFDEIRARLALPSDPTRTKQREDVEIMVMMTGYKVPTKRGPHDQDLVPLSCAADRWPEIVANWFNWSEARAAVLNLYFAVLFGKSLFQEHKFLFLAQAVEGYHRCRYDRDIPFVRRVEEVATAHAHILSFFINDIPKFCEEVRDIRNEFTHPGPGTPPPRSNVQLLWRQLRSLLEICFFHDLGLGAQVLERVAKRHFDRP